MSNNPTRSIRNHPQLIAYVMIVLAAGTAIVWQNYLGEQRKEQICYAEIEDRLLIEDILDFVSDPIQGVGAINRDFPPELQQLIEEARSVSIEFKRFSAERLDIPPTICDGTGITEQQVKDDQVRKLVREKGS